MSNLTAITLIGWEGGISPDQRANLKSLEVKVQLGGRGGQYGLSEHSALVADAESFFSRLAELFPQLEQLRVKLLVASRTGRGTTALRVYVDPEEEKTTKEVLLESDLEYLVQLVRELPKMPLAMKEVVLGDKDARLDAIDCCRESASETDDNRRLRIVTDGVSALISKSMTNIYFEGRVFRVKLRARESVWQEESRNDKIISQHYPDVAFGQPGKYIIPPARASSRWLTVRPPSQTHPRPPSVPSSLSARASSLCLAVRHRSTLSRTAARSRHPSRCSTAAARSTLLTTAIPSSRALQLLPVVQAVPTLRRST